MTGGGYSQLEESMSVLGVPLMTKASFIITERDIGEWWRTELVETMKAAEKRNNWLSRGVNTMRVYHQLQLLWMDDGVSAHTNIHTMQNLELG